MLYKHLIDDAYGILGENISSGEVSYDFAMRQFDILRAKLVKKYTHWDDILPQITIYNLDEALEAEYMPAVNILVYNLAMQLKPHHRMERFKELMPLAQLYEREFRDSNVHILLKKKEKPTTQQNTQSESTEKDNIDPKIQQIQDLQKRLYECKQNHKKYQELLQESEEDKEAQKELISTLQQEKNELEIQYHAIELELKQLKEQKNIESNEQLKQEFQKQVTEYENAKKQCQQRIQELEQSLQEYKEKPSAEELKKTISSQLAIIDKLRIKANSNVKYQKWKKRAKELQNKLTFCRMK